MFSNPDFQAYQESGQWSVKDSRVELTLTPSTLHTNIVFPAVEYHILLVRYVGSGQIGRGQWSVKDRLLVFSWGTIESLRKDPGWILIEIGRV